MHTCTDTVGQSWPRGTGSVGDSAGEGMNISMQTLQTLIARPPLDA